MGRPLFVPDQVFHRCVLDDELKSIVEFCNSQAVVGIFHHVKLLQKSCKVVSISPLCFMMFIHFARLAIDANV